ncbi:synaptotagmin-15-like isoform X2 [Frankliniella occidentalis]|uniref:Synaptotagmin-15-like isoform X2 n=1 Tax=Frankliniella occidentalis TaxID=133901 RepID=A0A9C6WWH2_FRAOC|nr:synaptotagmin-15-like isoform X2 [Frankliniella occidentalis]
MSPAAAAGLPLRPARRPPPRPSASALGLGGLGGLRAGALSPPDLLTEAAGEHGLPAVRDAGHAVASEMHLDHADAVQVLALCGAALGAVVVLVVVVVLCCRWRRDDHKSGEYDSLGPSIVVYPSYHGKGAQFLSSDISFKVPPIAKLRHTSSLDAMDLLDSDDTDGTSATSTITACTSQTLSAASPLSSHSQRSNSFSGCPLGALDPALYRGGACDLEEEMLFPEDHLGRLWFSAHYEPTAEKLQVTLLKAKNLQSRTVASANNCDPVVRLHLIPDERRHLQSRQKKKTCNPVFDETFVFQVPSKDLEDHVLRMTVVDTGRNKRRSVIGHVSFPLRRLAEEQDKQNVYKMDLEKDTPEAVSDIGELLVSLLYNENLHRLSVTVIEARRVKFRDEERRDSYVRVVMQQHHGQVKVKRTTVVRCIDDSPNFSECFNFHVPAASIDVTSLALQLEQPGTRYGRGHKLVGKCVLGSYMFARGKALTHWNTAFGNPMQQVQQWHALST